MRSIRPTSAISFISIILVFASCRQKAGASLTTNRSFYFWKSVFKLSEYEKKRMDSLQVKTFYVKFFDVDWNNTLQAPSPLAQVRMNDAAFLRSKNLIPVVFITNQCIYKIDSLQVKRTADKIYTLIKNIIVVNRLPAVKEIQIDCDWTGKTKEKYFSLLRNLIREDTAVIFSATIRLHQIKFSGKAGIPPVKKGLLMCYNMGNLKDPATKNSILESDELKKYIGNLASYPLPLDAGLPLFEWDVLLRKGNFAGLLQPLPAADFDSKLFERKQNFYTALSDTNLNGYQFYKGDIIRREQSDYKEIIQTLQLVRDKLPVRSSPINLSLYHLDSLTLSKYSLYEIENIYNGLR